MQYDLADILEDIVSQRFADARASDKLNVIKNAMLALMSTADDILSGCHINSIAVAHAANSWLPTIRLAIDAGNSLDGCRVTLQDTIVELKASEPAKVITDT